MPQEKKFLDNEEKELYSFFLNKIEEMLVQSLLINSNLNLPPRERLDIITMGLECLWLRLTLKENFTVADFNAGYCGLIENRNENRIQHLKYFLIKEKGEEFYNEFVEEYKLTSDFMDTETMLIEKYNEEQK